MDKTGETYKICKTGKPYQTSETDATGEIGGAKPHCTK
jgi:hypothetical protein